MHVCTNCTSSCCCCWGSQEGGVRWVIITFPIHDDTIVSRYGNLKTKTYNRGIYENSGTARFLKPSPYGAWIFQPQVTLVTPPTPSCGHQPTNTHTDPPAGATPAGWCWWVGHHHHHHKNRPASVLLLTTAAALLLVDLWLMFFGNHPSSMVHLTATGQVNKLYKHPFVALLNLTIFYTFSVLYVSL